MTEEELQTIETTPVYGVRNYGRDAVEGVVANWDKSIVPWFNLRALDCTIDQTPAKEISDQ